jgi:Protein of unknown function (DUF2510)
MYEFDSVSVSSYEAASLAAKLTEKSGEGWDVVSIVPAGSEITAYLRRAGSEGSTGTADAAGAGAASSTSSETAAPAATEPAGWGTAPESTPTSTPTSVGSTAAATAPTQAVPTAPAAPTTPAVPAGWYTDPAGRFELRYWDGSAWTEHVSRAGQQYTDPPVA